MTEWCRHIGAVCRDHGKTHREASRNLCSVVCHQIARLHDAQTIAAFRLPSFFLANSGGGADGYRPARVYPASPEMWRIWLALHALPAAFFLTNHMALLLVGVLILVGGQTEPLLAPELIVKPRFDEAVRLGVSAASVGAVARIATLGEIDSASAHFNLGGRQVPIRVLLDKSASGDLETFRKLRVRTSMAAS
ncbi:efflux RND transporter permease subunit [Mesorhizobium sp. INR15]|uniref:efflux RND transporter permease subunit n=1 Tax=Mesorhizobium sp. INR15 TaxID=2654248 RepID=UPI0018968D8E|nr:efflux RND transporter permease subunit [Mesorhizobium sp. INR15]